MALDEEDVRRPRRLLEPPPLDQLAVAELRIYIAELNAEIARASAVIDRKGGDRSAAEAVFGKR